MTANEIARQTFASRAAGYEAESPWVSNAALIDPLLAQLDAGSTVADVCAGTGAVGLRATELGFSVVALDLSADMLDRNPALLRTVAEGDRLPLADRAVDRVVCRQALHYLDMQQALKEFGRVARSDVSIGSITTIGVEDEQFWIDYFALASPARRVVFHPGDIERTLVSAGFEIVARTVLRDRGPLLGPIRHLPIASIEQVVAGFSDLEIRERYEVEGDGAGLSYLQRWEFVTGRLVGS